MTEATLVRVPVKTVEDAPTWATTGNCDRCGYSNGEPVAQAFVVVSIPSGGDLRFCGHHYAELADDLVAKLGIVSVVDMRHLINAKPECPSVDAK